MCCWLKKAYDTQQVCQAEVPDGLRMNEPLICLSEGCLILLQALKAYNLSWLAVMCKVAFRASWQDLQYCAVVWTRVQQGQQLGQIQGSSGRGLLI